MSLLSIQELSAFYGNFQALFGVSLEVAEGETVAVIGSNGAGKTTLLKLLALLTRPSFGTLTIAGGDDRDWNPARRRGWPGSK